MSDPQKFQSYINCLCDFIMAFLANPHSILQISYAKTFKMMYTRCPYNNIIQKYSLSHKDRSYVAPIFMNETLGKLKVHISK